MPKKIPTTVTKVGRKFHDGPLSAQAFATQSSGVRVVVSTEKYSDDTITLYVGDGGHEDYQWLDAADLDALIDLLKWARRKHFGKRPKAGGVVAGDETDPT